MLSSAHRASPTLCGPDLGDGGGGGGVGDGGGGLGLSKAKELSTTTVVHTTSIELKMTNRTSVVQQTESGV